MPSLCPQTALQPKKGFCTRFSCISACCSSPFFIDHCSTEPSLLTDTSSSGGCLSGPWSTQRVSQTMSVCFWLLLVEIDDPLRNTGSCLACLKSQIITEPSWQPAAIMLECAEEKCREVTPWGVR